MLKYSLIFITLLSILGCASVSQPRPEPAPKVSVQGCAITEMLVIVHHPIQRAVKFEPACRCFFKIDNEDTMQMGEVDPELCGIDVQKEIEKLKKEKQQNGKPTTNPTESIKL